MNGKFDQDLLNVVYVSCYPAPGGCIAHPQDDDEEEAGKLSDVLIVIIIIIILYL